MTDNPQTTIEVSGEEINAALLEQHRMSQAALQPALERNNMLVAEIERLRALVRELYEPACLELGPACEDIGKRWPDVLARALDASAKEPPMPNEPAAPKATPARRLLAALDAHTARRVGYWAGLGFSSDEAHRRAQSEGAEQRARLCLIVAAENKEAATHG